MNIKIKRFPIIRTGRIPACEKTGQVFILPGLIAGRWLITFFWLKYTLTVNFNTELTFETN